MRILLLGEYSNVHATLARALRERGHEVVVASNGDFWKNYPRDIDLVRQPGHWGGVKYMLRLLRQLPRFRGFDVVQLINPMFLELKAERIAPVYRYLRRHNRVVTLGAFGMDYYWVWQCCTAKPLRYSDFNMGSELRTNADALTERRDWVGTAKQRLNELVAHDCDAIVAGLYEYWACYHPLFPDKTTFIPYPIVFSPQHHEAPRTAHLPIKVFVGVSRNRSAYKGTDIMLKAAHALQQRYPDRMQLQEVCGVPFAQYVQMMRQADVILDQLYSYTPSMNSLEAMSHGVVVVGGGEPENYDILGERKLRPIINVQPNYDSVYTQLEHLLMNPGLLPQLSRDSMEYINRYHRTDVVALKYEQLWQHLLGKTKKA